MRRMKCSTLASVTLACVSFSGCGPRMRNDSDDGVVVIADVAAGESTSTGDLSQTATSAGPGSSSEPVDCPDGEVQCGTECADLRWSNDHCGSCDHACMHNGVGECWEGVCPPTKYCAHVEDGHETCGDVCAAYGQTCIDAEPTVPSACGGGSYGLYYGVGEYDCENGYWASSFVMGGCDDAIEWDKEGIPPATGLLPEAVSCCCTQP
jgi:hypothetical protein